MKLRNHFLIFTLLFLFQKGQTQDSNLQSFYFSTSASFSSVKDQLNYGFVFRGSDVKLDFGFRNATNTQIFDINLSAKFAGHFNDDMSGLGVHIEPLSVSRLYAVFEKNNYNLFVGPSFNSTYQYNLFPYLRSGHFSWMVNYNLGVKTLLLTSIKNKRLEVSFETSLVQLTSRPPLEIEPYWYSLNIIDWISESHQNMQAGFTNIFNTSKLQVELFFSGKKRRHSVGYTWQYMVYYDAPKFQQLLNNFSYRWYFKKIK